MQIFISTQTGVVIPLEVKPESTVANVMEKIHEREGIPTTQQRLVYHGSPLDANKKLSESGVEEASTIKLSLRLRAD